MTSAEQAAVRVYEQLLTRVGEATPRPRIEPARRLAELAGAPQLSFPIIHIAGTNGKTSTSRAIESLLRAHGLRTGLFTSPHLVSFTERFQIDGEPVGGRQLEEAWQELQLPLDVVDAELVAAGHGPVTFFEALAVLAFTVFADAPVDVVVLEVGMGGEWDSTNVADGQVADFGAFIAAVVPLLQPAQRPGFGLLAQVGAAGDEHQRHHHRQAQQGQAVVADFQQAIAHVANEHVDGTHR